MYYGRREARVRETCVAARQVMVIVIDLSRLFGWDLLSSLTLCVFQVAKYFLYSFRQVSDTTMRYGIIKM